MLHFVQTNPTASHAIVFLHGGGTTHKMWNEIVVLLPEYNCVLVDLPDHGGSRDAVFVGFEEAAVWVAEIIGTLEQETITVCGLSLGGYIAAAIGALNLHKVTGFVISGINVDPLPGKWWLLPLSYCMLPFLKTKFMMRNNAKMMGIPEHLMEEYMEGSSQMNKRAFLKITTEACDYTASDALQKTDVPIVLLAGEKENKVIINSTKAMPTRANHLDGYFIAGLGHVWTAQNPQLMATVLKVFVEEKPLPSELVSASEN